MNQLADINEVESGHLDGCDFVDVHFSLPKETIRSSVILSSEGQEDSTCPQEITPVSLAIRIVMPLTPDAEPRIRGGVTFKVSHIYVQYDQCFFDFQTGSQMAKPDFYVEDGDWSDLTDGKLLYPEFHFWSTVPDLVDQALAAAARHLYSNSNK